MEAAVAKVEYAKAIGRLGTCVRKLRWGGSYKDVERLRVRLGEAEQSLAALGETTALDAATVKTARRLLGVDGGDLADFARAMSERGLLEEARRARMLLTWFDPEMEPAVVALEGSHQDPEKATAALQDVAVDHRLPVRVRLLATWWLATTFGQPDLGDDVLMSLFGSTLRDQNWENAKRVLGAIRSVLRIRTGETDRYGESERPDFRMEFEQLRFDMTRSREERESRWPVY